MPGLLEKEQLLVGTIGPDCLKELGWLLPSGARRSMSRTVESIGGL